MLRIFSHGAAMLLLFFTSVIDEIAQMTLLLRHAESAEHLTGVASVLILGMLGAIIAGPIAARLITRFGPKSTLATAFLFQAVSLLMAAGYADQLLVVVLALLLGFSGSLYWSALLAAVSDIAVKLESTTDRVNSALQTIRNFGYIAGPSIGAALAATLNSEFIFILLAGGSLASLGILILIKTELVITSVSTYPSQSSSHTILSGLRILMSNSELIRVLWPFLVVVASTVPLNASLIFVITQDLELPATSYGLLVACLSLGLVIGPALGPMLANRFSYASITFSASGILGALLLVISQTHSVIVMIFSLFLGGIANGAINTTVASFVINSVSARYHSVTMPTFVMLIQLTALCGYLGVAFLPHEAAGTAILLGGSLSVAAAVASLIIHYYKTMQPKGSTNDPEQSSQ